MLANNNSDYTLIMPFGNVHTAAIECDFVAAYNQINDLLVVDVIHPTVIAPQL